MFIGPLAFYFYLNKYRLVKKRKLNTMFKKSTLLLLGAAITTVAISAYANSENDSVDLGKPSAVVEALSGDVAPLSKGTFSGRSDHITTGHVTLEKTATGYQLSFAADFSLDGAPDPIVALGNGETYLAANKIGTLKNKTGRQVYQLPASFTPAQFSQVYVWCEQFSVPLGVAQLTDI